MAAVSTLADSEQAALHKMLMRIVRGLQETGRVGQARMCIDCIYFRPDAHPGEREPHHCDYINAAFSDAGLRIDCNEFVPVTESRKEKAEK